MRDATPRRRGHALAALAAAVVLVACLASPCLAQSLVLENLVLDNQAGQVMLRFGVKAEGLDQIRAVLENGVTAGLECGAILSRAGGLMDQAVSEVSWKSLLRFDSLTREYEADIPGREKPLRNTDLEGLLRDAWGRINLDLGAWSSLERGHSYRVKMHLGMVQENVPAWLRRTLFFWSWTVAPATTYQLEFSY